MNRRAFLRVATGVSLLGLTPASSLHAQEVDTSYVVERWNRDFESADGETALGQSAYRADSTSHAKSMYKSAIEKTIPNVEYESESLRLTDQGRAITLSIGIYGIMNLVIAREGKMVYVLIGISQDEDLATNAYRQLFRKGRAVDDPLLTAAEVSDDLEITKESHES